MHIHNSIHERIQLLTQFRLVIEKGQFLGSDFTNDETINFYKVDSLFAIMYYSVKDRVINNIEWCDSLAKERQELLTYSIT